MQMIFRASTENQIENVKSLRKFSAANSTMATEAAFSRHSFNCHFTFRLGPYYFNIIFTFRLLLECFFYFEQWCCVRLILRPIGPNNNSIRRKQTKTKKQIWKTTKPENNYSISTLADQTTSGRAIFSYNIVFHFPYCFTLPPVLSLRILN